MKQHPEPSNLHPFRLMSKSDVCCGIHIIHVIYIHTPTGLYQITEI